MLVTDKDSGIGLAMVGNDQVHLLIVISLQNEVDSDILASFGYWM